jgi:uncharacterized protein
LIHHFGDSLAKKRSYSSEMPQTLSRMVGIDALRGAALLGVMLINLDTEFRRTFFEQFLAANSLASGDRIADAALAFLVEFKAITIFSMLFGVGLAIQHEAIVRAGRVKLLLVRRMLFLLGFGLIHMTLIWNGDILTEYALAGLMALPFIFGPTWILLFSSAASLLLFTLQPNFSLSLPFPTESWMIEHVAQARQVYGSGSFLEIARFRVAEIPAISPYLIYIFPRTLSLILFGAWVWRSGILQNKTLHSRWLLNFGWAAITLGAALSWLNGSGVPSPILLSPAVAHLVDVFSPVLLAIGYSILALRIFGAHNSRLTAWLAPVGRMAFTNYILQSVVLGSIFFGYGGGLLGQIGVLQGVALAFAIFTAQVGLSGWWLKRHHFGPLEWLWRSLMYGRIQPWARLA